MKKVVLTVVFSITMILSGCAPYDPYYQSQPVYVQPRPVYVPPPVYYRPPPPPPPRCYWVQRWDPQYRVNRNVRVCR